MNYRPKQLSDADQSRTDAVMAVAVGLFAAAVTLRVGIGISDTLQSAAEFLTEPVKEAMDDAARKSARG